LTLRHGPWEARPDRHSRQHAALLEGRRRARARRVAGGARRWRGSSRGRPRRGRLAVPDQLGRLSPGPGLAAAAPPAAESRAFGNLLKTASVSRFSG